MILIAELAVARKLIRTDFGAAGPATITALGGLVLALGATYWLIRESERRTGRPSRAGPRGPEAA